MLFCTYVQSVRQVCIQRISEIFNKCEIRSGIWN